MELMIKLQSIDVSDKRVFLRGDIDVPIRRQEAGNKRQEFAVEDTQRLQNLVPTIRFLFSKNCSILLAGHIGRPKNNQDFSLSTKTLLTVLSKLLDINVIHFATFKNVSLSPNTLGLLENLRFWQGEEKNSKSFAKKLAMLADVYVNEAFAVSHREHASIVGVPKFLPHAAGFRLQKEVEVLEKVLKNPKRPQVVIIGGVKLETKLPVITSFAKLADFVLVGGLVAKEAQEKKIVFGQNVILANLTPDGKDVNNASIDQFISLIEKARMVVWNGPMGKFEEVGNEKGTREIAKAIAKSPAYKIVGGGDTVSALKKFGLLDKMDWVSTGGGAMLELLAKGALPGIEALK